QFAAESIAGRKNAFYHEGHQEHEREEKIVECERPSIFPFVFLVSFVDQSPHLGDACFGSKFFPPLGKATERTARKNGRSRTADVRKARIVTTDERQRQRNSATEGHGITWKKGTDTEGILPPASFRVI